MNNEGDEQNEQNDSSLEKKAIDEGKDAIRKESKKALNNVGKEAGKLTGKIAMKVAAIIAANIVPIAIMLIVVVIVSFIASSFYAVQDKLRNIAGNISGSIGNVVEIGDNGPIIPSKKELLESIEKELDNLGIKKEDLYLGNENQANAYLYKYMMASLSTQLPYIDDSTAEKIMDIALKLNPITFVLSELEKSQEVQGIVKIYRYLPDADSSKRLKYLKYGKSSQETDETDTADTTDETEESGKSFSKLVAENDSSALDYFSIDEDWMLCVAKYQKVTVSGSSSENAYTIQEVKIPYKTMVQNYTIPFSFLITLQQMTQNAEYVSKVADMIMESGEIEVTLYDTIETVTSEYTYKYDQMKKWVEEVPEAIGEDINGNNENSDTGSGESGTTDTGTGTGSGTTVNNPNAPPTPPTGVKPTISDRASVKRIATTSLPLTDTISGTNDANTGESSQTSTPTKKVYRRELVSEGNEEKTTTVTETNTITANVTKANVWVISHTAEYEKDTPPAEYPLGEDGVITELEDEEEPEGDEGEWKINRSETTKETNIKQGWKAKENETKIDPDEFLGMWKNSYGIYISGVKFDPTGKLVKYTLPGSVKKKTTESEDGEEYEGKVKESPIKVLLTAEDMFYTLLENREETQTHAQIMRELIKYYKAKINGKDYTINVDLSIFDAGEFTGATYGSSTAKEFIHYFEGTPKQTADGTKYVVFNDGAGNLTVGWGVYINAHKGRFAARGINASTLKEGSTVDKTIVDSIEDEIIQEYRDYVLQVVSGLGLEEYQIDALTSRAFNCGTSGGMSGFVQAYTQYGNTDPLYTNLLSKPVTSKGKYLAGLETRRKAEWNLFHTGYYINTGSYYSPQGAASSSIVDKAKQCHDYVRNNGFRYEQSGQNIPINSSSKKTIDCSSFVSWVLYEAGYSQFAGYQKTSSYFASNPMNWEKVTKENLQAGDIMVFSNHVQIYAGNGSYYNCGTDTAIQTEAPSGRGRSANDSGFLFGLRPN